MWAEGMPRNTCECEHRLWTALFQDVKYELLISPLYLFPQHMCIMKGRGMSWSAEEVMCRQ